MPQKSALNHLHVVFVVSHIFSPEDLFSLEDFDCIHTVTSIVCREWVYPQQRGNHFLATFKDSFCNDMLHFSHEIQIRLDNN